MKRIKKYLTMKWCAMISALIGVLGFAATGCDRYGADLYGQPYAKFKIDGAVLNEEGSAIEGVKVYVRGNYGDTATTDRNGKYMFDAPDISSSREFWVMAKDPSGVYATDSVRIETNFKGGDGDWYSGSYSTTYDFKLKKEPVEAVTPKNPEETVEPETPTNPEE